MKSFRSSFFLSALWKKFNQDNALFLARGLAFDVLLCLIPATFLLFILFGFLFESPQETSRYMMNYMKSMIPFSSQQVLRSIFAVVRAKKVLGVAGGIGLIWTLSRVYGSVRTVLDSVFQVKNGRGILRGKIFDLKVMLLTTLFFLATVLVTFIFSLLKKIGGLALGTRFLYLGTRGELISILLTFFFTVCAFFCLYRFIPYRRIRTGNALFGALCAGILWEVAKNAFRLYLLNIVDLNQVFGSFGLLFALFLWIYYSCIVFILGAEMACLWGRKT